MNRLAIIGTFFSTCGAFRSVSDFAGVWGSDVGELGTLGELSPLSPGPTAVLIVLIGN